MSMSTKSKSTLTETPSKSTPVTPRMSRGLAKSGADSPASPFRNSFPSLDNSARSRPSLERRSSKLTTLPDKKPSRIVNPLGLQAELKAAQEDLKNAKEKLALVEKEKAQALEAQQMAEEANEKLREALVAQKQAKEDSEIEVFRAVEMEQLGIEAFQKKEEEWLKEVEAVRNQHAVDVAALLSATQELQRAKRELAMACDAKNQALNSAEDAAKFAAQKVEILSSELVRLKSLLDSRNAWYETEVNEKNKLVDDLKFEMETLKQELEKANSYEAILVEKEAIVKQLNVELEAAKMAESYAHNRTEEWKKTAEDLEVQAKEAHYLERSASVTVMKQLETSNVLFHDAELEIASLKEKVGLLEMSMARQEEDLEESEHYAQMAKEEASEMAMKVDSLISDLETVKEEKIQAIKNEKVAADSVHVLLEEKNRLIIELERSRDEEEKSKKAMESLASALHEVSSEEREAKEKLLSSQAEHEHYETQIEDLKLELKARNEKYECLLDEAKEKLDALTNSVERSTDEHQKLKDEWEEKELHLMSCMKKIEEENSSLEKEMVNLIRDAEKEACARKDEEAQLKNSLKEAECQVTYLKGESIQLKECLMDKENEVQNILRENEELQSREVVSLKKVEELSVLLEMSLAKTKVEANGELSDSEKDYDMLPKVVEFSEQNGGGRVEKPKMELPPYQPVEEEAEELLSITSDDEPLNSNGKLNEFENKEKEDDLPEGEYKMWESCKLGDNDGRESHINGLSTGENVENGGMSPTKQKGQKKKKKKPLFHKFGSLLKKKTTQQSQVTEQYNLFLCLTCREVS